MINIFAVLVVCFVLSSFRNPPDDPQLTLCTEKRDLVNGYKRTFQEIGDSAMPPTEKDVITLVKPLTKSFTLDEGQCQGFTEQVRGISKEIIKKRASEITSTLQQICSAETDPNSTDVIYMAAMKEERIGAQEALIILHKSTTGCLAN